MDQHQRELRRAAAQAFSESLEVLQKGLQPVDNSPTAPTAPGENDAISHSTSAPAAALTPNSDLSAWEDAAADIEEFIKSRQTP